MPWEKSFDRAQAVRDAMDVFWRCGYEGTGINQLVEATGASRYGLYDEFGDKRGLFLEALDAYVENVVRRNLGALENDDAGLADIHGYYERMLGMGASEDNPLGCLMCMTAMTMDGADEAIAERVAGYIERLRGSFARALVNAKTAGDISPGADPQALAAFLVGLTQGAAVMDRAGTGGEAIEQQIRIGLTILDTA